MIEEKREDINLSLKCLKILCQKERVDLYPWNQFHAKVNAKPQEKFEYTISICESRNTFSILAIWWYAIEMYSIIIIRKIISA